MLFFESSDQNQTVIVLNARSTCESDFKLHISL